MAKCEACIYYPKCEEYPFDESGCKDIVERSRFIEVTRLEELRHFLVFEIERNHAWQKDFLNPFYDGVYVGLDKARTLRRAHIRFCERLLAMIDKEVSGE